MGHINAITNAIYECALNELKCYINCNLHHKTSSNIKQSSIVLNYNNSKIKSNHFQIQTGFVFLELTAILDTSSVLLYKLWTVTI